MNKTALVTLALVSSSALAQTGGSQPVPVTPDNFVRTETDMYFARFAKNASGKFYHVRDLPLGEDTGVRPNRDTLYSMAVFDLDAGPVTITLPDAGKRFMTMMVVDQDHYVPMVVSGKGTSTLRSATNSAHSACPASRTSVAAAAGGRDSRRWSANVSADDVMDSPPRASACPVSRYYLAGVRLARTFLAGNARLWQDRSGRTS
jgi:hypothetical protein